MIDASLSLCFLSVSISDMLAPVVHFGKHTVPSVLGTTVVREKLGALTARRTFRTPEAWRPVNVKPMSRFSFLQPHVTQYSASQRFTFFASHTAQSMNKFHLGALMYFHFSGQTCVGASQDHV